MNEKVELYVRSHLMWRSYQISFSVSDRDWHLQVEEPAMGALAGELRKDGQGGVGYIGCNKIDR